MELVEKLDEAIANVALLDQARHIGIHEHRTKYLELIRLGTCFLPYQTLDGLAFAPSRFIGYAGNSLATHDANSERDGRQTNAALNAILKQEPVEEIFEEDYQRFCKALGFQPRPKGSFGVTRKFWDKLDIGDRLGILAENEVMTNPNLSQTERSHIVKSRIGQGVFRDSLLDKWDRRCCMSGCAIHSILRASHIKPWRHSSNEERLDVYNGLLLSPNMDALFDQGFITFSDKGKLLHSETVSTEELVALGCRPNLSISFDHDHKPYLEYHRKEVFKSRME